MLGAIEMASLIGAGGVDDRPPSNLFILDVEERRPMRQDAASDGDLEIRSISSYAEPRFADELVVDRVDTGVLDAVWCGGVAAVQGARIVQFDNRALGLVAEGAS